MIRLILASLLLTLGIAFNVQAWLVQAPAAGGSIALVGSQKAIAGNAGAGQTLGITLNGTTAGNLLVLGTIWCKDTSCSTATGAPTISSITGGPTFTHATLAGTCAVPDGSNVVLIGDVWYAKNIAGGNVSATINLSASGFYLTGAISEWSGASQTAPDNGVGNCNAVQSTANLSVATNGNTTASGDLIYAIWSTGNIGTPGQTALSTKADNKTGDEYQIAGAAGSYSNSVAQTANSAVLALVAFKK